MTQPRFVPLPGWEELPPEVSQTRARSFFEEVRRRRTVRAYDPRPVPDGVIEDCLRAAGTAPSGANLQPWHFVVVRDAGVKRRIRAAADEWLAALAPLGTDASKPFLETAPVLIAVFGERYGLGPDGRKHKRYYVDESVGLATGVLITALHHAGLATLTHTPSPMGFLRDILGRPENERPFLLLVVGYPAPDARVPDIGRKPLEEIATFL